MKAILLVLCSTAVSLAADYTASRVTVDSTEVIRLTDAAHKIEVSIVPSIGNTAYEFKVNGQNIMWSPYKSLAEWKAKPVQIANPLLAPWANRIDQDSYWINGKKYLLNAELNNFRRDPNGLPMHGLLQFAQWKVVRLEASASEAVMTSRLEYWRHPEWMAQFPFAFNLQMTHRLKDGALEIETVVENLSGEAFPLSLSYHTYYRLFDAPRDEWRVHVAAAQQMMTDQRLIPTGAVKPVALPDPVGLKDASFDSIFSGLKHDPGGTTTFWVQGKTQKITVVFGHKFPIAVLFSPPNDPARQFMCFEPMTGPTNLFNMIHAGTYKDAQTVAPGGEWHESFWIRPSGF
jgi:aldose 1-epimerase